MNVLVLSPHPDDDLLGCGGSIMKHIDNGNAVSVVYMTSGEAGGKNNERLGDIRENEAKKAARAIGIPEQSLYFLHQPDGHIAEIPEVVELLINLIRKIKPSVVYMPHSNDDSSDHKMTYKIGMKATSEAAMAYGYKGQEEPWTVGTVLAYEVWTPIQRPEYLEDISDVIDRKIMALGFHKSQLEIIAYDDMTKGLGLYRGATIGKGSHVEAFQILALASSSVTAS